MMQERRPLLFAATLLLSLEIAFATTAQATFAQNAASDHGADSKGIQAQPDFEIPSQAEYLQLTFEEQRKIARHITVVLGEEKLGVEFLELSLSAVEKQHPQANMETFIACSTLANTYFLAQEYAKSVELAQRTLTVAKEIFPRQEWPKGYVETLSATMLLGRYHLAMGDQERFVRYMDDAVELIDNAPQISAFLLSNIRAQVAQGLRMMGRIDKANEYCLKAVDIISSANDADLTPDDNVLFQETCWLCAFQFYNTGDIIQAKRFATKAVEFLDAPGVELRPIAKAKTLQILAGCHRSLGEYAPAAKYLRLAYELNQKTDARASAGMANELAEALLELGQRDEARKWLEIAQSYQLGTDDTPIYFHATAADFLAHEGRIAEARKLLVEGIRLQDEFRKGLDTSGLRYKLAKLEVDQGNTQAATDLLIEARDQQYTQLQQIMTSRSEAAAISYLHFDWLKITNLFLSATQSDQSRSGWKQQYDLILQQRGLIMRALATRNRVRRNMNGEGRKLFQAYLEKMEELTQFPDRSEAIHDELEVLEAQLGKQAPELLREMERLFFSLEKLQQNIANNEVAIDFVYYKHEEHKSLAIFLISSEQVFRTDIKDASVLSPMIQKWREAIAQGYGEETALELHQFLWARIEKQIPAAVDTLYLFGDGDLALLPWSAVRRPDDTILLEHFAIATPPYPQHLVERNSHNTEASGFLAVGDVAFGQAKNKENRSTFPSLHHTAAELDALAKYAAKTDQSLQELRGNQATVANLLDSVQKNVRYLHVASHGESESVAGTLETANAPLLSNRVHPLESNALVLAGAFPNGNNGKLSGTSIANLDLSQLELVFLSACDSGVGDSVAGEGVFGLQRGFHLAGAHNVICSLWQLDDAATALLVQKFYKNFLIRKLPPLHALREAQLELFRNPLQLSEFKSANRGTFAGSRGFDEDKTSKKRERKVTTSAIAAWAGITFSGSSTVSVQQDE